MPRGHLILKYRDTHSIIKGVSNFALLLKHVLYLRSHWTEISY